MKTIFRSVTVLVLTILMAVFFSACSFILDNQTNNNVPGTNNQKTPASVLDVDFKELTATERQELSLVNAIEKVERSVVAIEIGGGAGAGVIIDLEIEGLSDDNVIYIVTCHHVIASKGDITVYIPDENCSYLNADYVFTGTIGGAFSANANKAVTLVGGDLSSDIAIIKIDLSKPAYSGNILSIDKIVKAVIPSENYSVRKGESVFAIGNPTGGLPGWVCTGVISALEETVPVDEIGNMLLTGISVTTNPGNSGGGLFNLYGELVGITNAGNTNYEAINFAIPLYTSNASNPDAIDNGMVNIVKQLAGTATSANYGYVPGRRTLLGITVAKGTGESNQEYTYIYSVTAGGVAATAGIVKDDIITAISVNGVPKSDADTFEEYNEVLSALKVGDTVKITVDRQIKQNNRWITVQYSFNINITQFHFCDTGL